MKTNINLWNYIQKLTKHKRNQPKILIVCDFMTIWIQYCGWKHDWNLGCLFQKLTWNNKFSITHMVDLMVKNVSTRYFCVFMVKKSNFHTKIYICICIKQGNSKRQPLIKHLNSHHPLTKVEGKHFRRFSTHF